MIEGILFDWTGTLYEKRRGLFPDAFLTLELLKPKYRMGLVSRGRGNGESRVKEIREAGVWDFFDAIVIDPNKEVEQFSQCIEKMDVSADKVLLVGDRTAVEIRVGNTLGCQTYWIRRGEYVNELPNKATGRPKRIIETVSDILRYL